MSGMQELTKNYLDKINNVLEGKPEYLRGFVNYMNDSSIRTKYNYLNHIVAFMKWNEKEASDLGFDDFNNYISVITYKEDGSKTTSSYQINIYSSLKKFCEYLYASKRISENYMLYIKRPKAKDSQETVTKRENGYLNERELKKFVRNVELPTLSFNHIQAEEWDIRDKALIFTFILTGIRSSALRLLDVSDVDLKNKTMVVTEKGEKVRTYDIPDKLCEALEDWIECREKLMKGHDSNALFISLKRNRMCTTAIYNLVKKYADCISDKNITPHKLRATYGTQLYNKTGDIYFVQECMGHSSPKVTELYIRDKKENTKRASDIMEKLL
jgi:integrase/recombinase XerC